MGKTYYHWSTSREIPLVLQLVSPSGGGATGLSPEVAIRRWRDSDGNLLDGYFWNGSGFVSAAQWLAMTEVDAVNFPGAYEYNFEQPGTQQLYLVYFRNTVAPLGFDVEQHIVTDELFIPAASPAVPILPGDTVMGRLAAMEDPDGAVAEANADAVWDETLADHLLPGTTGEALAACSAGHVGAHQIDITVKDDGGAPIQGCQVDVYDAANVNHIFRVWTDVNGEVSIALDADNYNVRLFASGFAFTVPEPLAVTGDAAVEFVGTSLTSLVTPSAPDLCVIFGTIRDALGRPISGACVEAYAYTPQTVSGIQKGDRVGTTVTDANGWFQIELVRNAVVQFTIEGTAFDFERTVPDLPSQDVTTWT